MPWITWFWLGHSTFLSSADDSWMKRQTRAKRLPPPPARAASAAGRASGAAPRRGEVGFARHG